MTNQIETIMALVHNMASDKEIRAALEAALKPGEHVATVDDEGVIVVCSYKYKPGDMLYTAAPPAQTPALKPGGEPVARVDDLERGGRVRALAIGLALDAPLFAAPPRREPLTNQQVKEMWRKHAPNIGGIFDFAAELQQYHGIGGKE
jgi:hypothetical protein